MTKQIDDTQQGKIKQAQSNLEQREDMLGKGYRTIRDNPKTSAAIGAGVVAAAAGGAFLLNRKGKIGTATGHASTNDEIANEVSEMNEDAVSKLNQKEIKSGSVAY
ncbi:MAG: hypothetical protein HKO13_06545 [Sphingomonas sp.]|nr:hypothetical protein [Sphingomonas sp.]